MAGFSDQDRGCDHQHPTSHGVCPLCLKRTWIRTQQAITQAAVIRMAHEAARKEREQAREGRSKGAGSSQALVQAGSQIRSDPAVNGWGARTIARPGLAERSAPSIRPLRRRREENVYLARSLCRQAEEFVTAVADARAQHRRALHRLRDTRLERLKQLPPDQFAAVNLSLTTALDLAQEGRLADGYTVLLESWQRATAAAARAVPWSTTLRWIYGLALENYVWRYGMALE